MKEMWITKNQLMFHISQRHTLNILLSPCINFLYAPSLSDLHYEVFKFSADVMLTQLIFWTWSYERGIQKSTETWQCNCSIVCVVSEFPGGK